MGRDSHRNLPLFNKPSRIVGNYPPLDEKTLNSLESPELHAVKIVLSAWAGPARWQGNRLNEPAVVDRAHGAGRSCKLPLPTGLLGKDVTLVCDHLRTRKDGCYGYDNEGEKKPRANVEPSWMVESTGARHAITR